MEDGVEEEMVGRGLMDGIFWIETVRGMADVERQIAPGESSICLFSYLKL